MPGPSMKPVKGLIAAISGKLQVDLVNQKFVQFLELASNDQVSRFSTKDPEKVSVAKFLQLYPRYGLHFPYEQCVAQTTPPFESLDGIVAAIGFTALSYGSALSLAKNFFRALGCDQGGVYLTKPFVGWGQDAVGAHSPIYGLRPGALNQALIGRDAIARWIGAKTLTVLHPTLQNLPLNAVNFEQLGEGMFVSGKGQHDHDCVTEALLPLLAAYGSHPDLFE
jgi:hypothetical protein